MLVFYSVNHILDQFEQTSQHLHEMLHPDSILFLLVGISQYSIHNDQPLLREQMASSIPSTKQHFNVPHQCSNHTLIIERGMMKRLNQQIQKLEHSFKAVGGFKIGFGKELFGHWFEQTQFLLVAVVHLKDLAEQQFEKTLDFLEVWIAGVGTWLNVEIVHLRLNDSAKWGKSVTMLNDGFEGRTGCHSNLAILTRVDDNVHEEIRRISE